MARSSAASSCDSCLLIALVAVALTVPRLGAQQTMPAQPALAPMLTNSIAIELVLVPAGDFMMGAYIKNRDSNPDG